MQVDIHTGPSIFEELADEWHDLLQRAVTNHIFMTPEFASAWWETIGDGELQVITVRKDGKLVGLAPLFLSPQKELHFLGCTAVSDYLDFLVDREFTLEVYQQLEKIITLEVSYQKLTLCSIPEKSPTLRHFNQAKHMRQDICPVITLPQTWEEYLEMIGKKQRHEIKRKWEKLFREADAQFEELSKEEEMSLAVGEFITLHQKSSENKKEFWDAKHVQFFQTFLPRLAAQGWVKLFFLKIAGKRVASMLVFAYNQQFFLYNSGFDAEQYRSFSVGNVLTSYTIQRAIEDSCTRYDFLRGDEEYKFRFGAVAEAVFDLSWNKQEAPT